MGDRYIPIVDFDALITAINSLAAPSGTNVAISPTGMHIVTEDDVQGAISELDAKAYEINASLTKSEWQTLGTSSSRYRVDKGFVFIRVHNADTQARTELTLGTLPSELRPTSQVNAPIVGGSYHELTGVCQVKSGGDVTLYTNSAGRFYGYFCFSV